MSQPDVLLQRAREIVCREAAAVASVAEQLDENLLAAVSLLLARRGHVLTLGAGTSRAVAVRFAHLLSCSGIPALALNPADALHGGAGAIMPDDVLFVISKGGRSREVNDIAAIARARGARVITQTETDDSPLAQLSDVVIIVSAGEGIDPFGMVATGSSLINCTVGDVLCVLLLELGGYSREAFGSTHPEGAVGEKLRQQHD